MLGLAAAAAIGAWLAMRDPIVEVRMAVPPQKRSAAVFVAMDKGYFADQRLKVTITPIVTGKECLARTLAGEFDFAVTSVFPVVASLVERRDPAVLALLAQLDKQAGIVTTRAIGGNPAALRGRKVGFVPGTTSEVFLRVMLDSARVAAAAVALVPLDAEDSVNAIAAGTVDAVSTWEPYLSRAAARLSEEAVTIVNDGSFVDYALLAVSGDWLKDHDAVARRVLSALVAATSDIHAHPDEARAIAERWTPADDPWAADVYLLRLDSAMPFVLETTARIALGTDVLPLFDDAIRPRPLRAVAPSAVMLTR
jgi:NitT/TauT family transport system substrate-binding protein